MSSSLDEEFPSAFATGPLDRLSIVDMPIAALMENLDGNLVVSDAKVRETLRRLREPARIVGEPWPRQRWLRWIGSTTSRRRTKPPQHRYAGAMPLRIVSGTRREPSQPDRIGIASQLCPTLRRIPALERAGRGRAHVWLWLRRYLERIPEWQVRPQPRSQALPIFSAVGMGGTTTHQIQF